MRSSEELSGIIETILQLINARFKRFAAIADFLATNFDVGKNVESPVKKRLEKSMSLRRLNLWMCFCAKRDFSQITK
ncbi:MAG: hypothetical protein AAFP07_20415 [Cyanobacteria bacterium J06606_4]